MVSRYYLDMVTADNIVFLLERIGRILQNDAHVAGLKPAQWEALRFLGRANRFSRNPSALRTYLGITKGTVSQTLIALERKGFIKKETTPQDRRNILIELTPAGTEILKDDPISSLEKLVGKMTGKDRTVLEENLRSLLKMTLAERGGIMFGPCMSCKHFERNAKDGEPHRCGLLDVTLSESDSKQRCIENTPKVA